MEVYPPEDPTPGEVVGGPSVSQLEQMKAWDASLTQLERVLQEACETEVCPNTSDWSKQSTSAPPLCESDAVTTVHSVKRKYEEIEFDDLENLRPKLKRTNQLLDLDTKKILCPESSSCDISDTTSDPVSQLVHEEENKFVPPSENYLNDLGDHKDTSTLSFNIKEDKPYVNDVEDKTLLDVDKKILVHETEIKPLANQTPTFVFEDKKDVLDFMDSKKCMDFVDNKESITHLDCKNSTGVEDSIEDSKNISLMDCKSESIKQEVCDEVKPTIVNTKDETDFKELEVGDVAKVEPIVNSEVGMPTECKPETTCTDNANSSSPVDATGDSKSKEKKRKKDEESSESCKNTKKDDKKRKKFERCNIRDIRLEENLDAVTLAAQKEEKDRIQRIQEAQMRALQERLKQIEDEKEVLTQLFSQPPPEASHLFESSSEENADLAGDGTSKPELPLIRSENDVVLLESSDEEKKAKLQELIPSTQTTVENVIDISSSDSDDMGDDDDLDKKDDDIMVLSDEGDTDGGGDAEDPNNSGAHTNDCFNMPDMEGRVLVNVGHPPEDPDIFLAPQIAKVIKPHQIGGIRFLYDNVVENLERYKSSSGFGCILAHSMGLGKTVQVVSFVDVFLRHTPATLVLCIVPINTIQNWKAEFDMWVPSVNSVDENQVESGEIRPRDYNVYTLNENFKTMAARAALIAEWRRHGGVLLMGYEMYRMLALRKMPKIPVKKSKRQKKLEAFMEPETNDQIKKYMDQMYEHIVIPGPDLVICDEGHRIKNSLASTSMALKSIKTRRRVVLTGYPLQNNLLEYWCMVDFVRPNYLGSRAEFCNMFERPISNGQCIDSTPRDRQLMRFRSHVLHSLLVGFVQRRGHSVLRAVLPKKEEHVLLIRMTPIQRKLYKCFVKDLLYVQKATNPLKLFAVCCKIWNHPDILYKLLQEKKMQEDIDLDIDLATLTPGSTIPGSNCGLKKKATPAKQMAKVIDRMQPVKLQPKPMKPLALHSPQSQTQGQQLHGMCIESQQQFSDQSDSQSSNQMNEQLQYSQSTNQVVCKQEYSTTQSPHPGQQGQFSQQQQNAEFSQCVQQGFAQSSQTSFQHSQFSPQSASPQQFCQQKFSQSSSQQHYSGTSQKNQSQFIQQQFSPQNNSQQTSQSQYSQQPVLQPQYSQQSQTQFSQQANSQQSQQFSSSPTAPQQQFSQQSSTQSPQQSPAQSQQQQQFSHPSTVQHQPQFSQSSSIPQQQFQQQSPSQTQHFSQPSPQQFSMQSPVHTEQQFHPQSPSHSQHFSQQTSTQPHQQFQSQPSSSAQQQFHQPTSSPQFCQQTSQQQQKPFTQQASQQQQQSFSQQSSQQFSQKSATQQQFPQAPSQQQYSQQSNLQQSQQYVQQQYPQQSTTPQQQQQQQQYSQQSGSQQQYPQQTNSQQQQQYSQQATQPPQQYSQQTSGTQQYSQQSSNQEQQQYHQQSSSQQHYPQQSNTQQYSLQPNTQQYSQQGNAQQQQQQFPRQSPPQSQFPQQGHVAQQNFPQASPQSQFPQPSPPLQSQQFSQPSPQPQSSPQQFPRQSSPQQMFPQPSPPIQQYSQQSPPQQQQFSQQSPPQPLSSPHQYSKSSPPHQGYPQQFSQQSSSPYPQPSPPHQQFQQPSHKYPQDTSPQQQYPQYPQQPSPQQQFSQSSSQQSYSHQSSQQYMHSGQQYPQQHSPQHFPQQAMQNQFSQSPQQQYSHQTVPQQQQYSQQPTSQSSFPHQQAQTSSQSQSHFSQPSPQSSSQQFSKPSSQNQPFNQPPPVSTSQPQFSQHQPVQSSTKQFNQQQQSPSTAPQQQFGQQSVPSQQSFNPQQSVSPQHQYNQPQVGSTQQQFNQPHQVSSSQQTFNQQGQVLSSQQQYSAQPQPASTVAPSYTPKASQPVSSQSFVQQQYSQQTHSSQSQQYTQQQCHQSSSAQQYQQQNFTQQPTQQLYQQQMPQTQQTSSVQITPIPQSPETKQPPAVGRGRGKQSRNKQICQPMQQSYVQQTSDMKHSAQYTMQNFHQQNASAQTMVQQQSMQQTNKQIQKRAGQHHFQPIVKQEGVTLQPIKQEPNTLPAKCQKAILHTTTKPQTLCQQTMLPSRQQMLHQMPMKNHLDGSQIESDQHCTAPVHDVVVPSYQNRMDSSISYEWAIPIMKDYIVGVLENSHKMMVLFVIIERTILIGDKILVFSQSLSTLDLLEHFLSKTAVPRRPDLPEDTPVENWCRNKNYFRLDGSTSAQEREKLINEFNRNENVSLFLLSTRAGCLGINLVGANRIVVMDASWNPCHDAQAVCRIYRYGQKKPCHIYRLVTDNSLEKKIYDRQVNKQGMSDRVVDELNPESNFTWKDVTTLIQDNEDDGPVQELHNFASGYTDEVLKYLVTNMSHNLSKEPFEHESLLLDRKDLKLTKQEKRLAKQSYEMAKRANMINIRTTYTYLPAGAAGTGGQFVINNKQCQWVGGTTIRVLPSQSTPIPMQPSGVTATIRTGTTATPITASPSLMNTLFKQGVMVQKLTMPSNVSIPVLTPGSPPVVIPAGQDVLVLRTPKGVYLRLPDGRIIAVQLPPSLLAKTQFRPNVVTHFRPQQKAGNKQTATGINTPRGQSIGIIKQTLQCGGTVRFVGPRNATGGNAQNANRSSAPEVIDLSDDDEPSSKKNSSASVHPTSYVDGESGNFEQPQETSQDTASKPSPVQVQQKQITIRRISPTSQPNTVQLSSVQDKKCELPKVLQQSQQITIMPINTTSQQNKGNVAKNVLQSSNPIQIQQMVLPAPKRKVPPKNTSKIQLPSPLLSAKHLQQNQITISPTPSFQPHLQNSKSRQTSPFPQTNLPQLTIKPIESVPSTNSSVQSQQILSNVKNSVLPMSSSTTQADNSQLMHNSQSITVQSTTTQPQQKSQQAQNLQRSALKPSLSQQVQVDAAQQQQQNFSNPNAQLHTNQSQQQQMPQTSQTQVNTQSMHQPSVQTSAIPRQKSHVPQQQSLLPPAMQAKVQAQSQLPSSNSSTDPKPQPHALQSFMQQQQQQLAHGPTPHPAPSLGTSAPSVTQPVQPQTKKRKQPANRSSSSKKSQPPTQLNVQSNLRQSQTSDMSRQFSHTQLPDHSLVDAHFPSFSHHITNSDFQSFPSFSAPKPVTPLQHPQPLHPLQHNQEHAVPPHLQHMAHMYPLQHIPPNQQPVSDLQSQAPRAWSVPQPPVSSFHPYGQSSLYYNSGHSHDNSQFSLQPSFPPSQTSTTASVSQSESSSNTSSLDPSSSICSSEL